MNQKEITKLNKRAELLEKAIKKNVGNGVWQMILELIEIELELEAESNK